MDKNLSIHIPLSITKFKGNLSIFVVGLRVLAIFLISVTPIIVGGGKYCPSLVVVSNTIYYCIDILLQLTHYRRLRQTYGVIIHSTYT